VALMLVALFALVGLVFDGGTELAAHQAAVDEAEQAARAGAASLSIDALRSGSLRLDPRGAAAAAEAFTVAAGHPGAVTVAAGTVTVSVRYRVPTSILGIVGIASLPVSATATAVDLGGVTRGAP
jgi:Flp pilus assembly protein TadG